MLSRIARNAVFQVLFVAGAIALSTTSAMALNSCSAHTYTIYQNSAGQVCGTRYDLVNTFTDDNGNIIECLYVVGASTC